MILSDIRRYIETRGQVALADIALHFDADPDAVRGMLEVWIQKGKIYRQMATASCGGSCTQCDSATTEIYVWNRQPANVIPVVPELPAGCGHR